MYAFTADINYVWTTRNEGLTRFRGWFPMITGYSMTEDRYIEHQRTPWPDEGDETITTRPFWPEEDTKTITVHSHPELTHPASGFSDQQASDLLKKLKQRKRDPFT